MNVAELLNKTDLLINEINSCKNNSILYGIRMDENFKKYSLFFLKTIKSTNGIFGHSIVPNLSICNRIIRLVSNFYNMNIKYETITSYERNFELYRFNNIDDIDISMYNNLKLFNNSNIFYRIESSDNLFRDVLFLKTHIFNYSNHTSRYEIFLICSGNYTQFKLNYRLYMELLRQKSNQDLVNIKNNINANQIDIKLFNRNNVDEFMMKHTISAMIRNYFQNHYSSKLLNNFYKLIDVPMLFKEGV